MSGTTDQQRREVAARLRWAATGAYKHLPMVDLLASVAGANVSGMGKGEANNAVYARLADLIDRPACRDESDNDEFFVCSVCGANADLTEFEIGNYCANCGAEVVE